MWAARSAVWDSADGVDSAWVREKGGKRRVESRSRMRGMDRILEKKGVGEKIRA